MAAAKLSVQDRKDLDKFAKYLVYKCIQIIVQSRLGEKVKTRSKAFSTGSDWFNLAVVDIPEVKSETVKVFNGTMAVGQYVCVEISLKTAEGETMVLETWTITMTEQVDSGARVSYTVYNRMGLLLKSLFSVSRSTPSYRLARKQGPETFVICYRIYMGEPQYSHLGDGYQDAKVGMVLTPLGTFTLSVAYRTKMLISPHTSTKDLCEDLRENHFNSECSPKKVHSPQPCRNGFRGQRPCSTDEALVFGDVQDICTTTFTSSPTDHSDLRGYVGTPPPHSVTPPPHTVTPPPHQRKASADVGKCEDNKENIPSRADRASGGQNWPRICAFHPYLELDDQLPDDDDIPFNSLLQPPCPYANGCRRDHSPDGDSSQGDAVDHRMGGNSSGSSSGSSTTDNRSSQSANSSSHDDFVMVELKTPFAGPEGNSDLGRFYQDCQVAPPLSMFQETITIQDTINSITNQLAGFEASSKDFDEFVDSLVTSDG